jgi:hypothetical protein
LALLTVQQISSPKLQATYTAVNATDTIPNQDDIFLHVKNANAGTVTVTFTDPGKTPAGSSATNPSTTLATGTEAFVPVNQNLIDPSTGVATVAYSPTTSVTAALVRM